MLRVDVTGQKTGGQTRKRPSGDSAAQEPKRARIEADQEANLRPKVGNQIGETAKGNTASTCDLQKESKSKKRQTLTDMVRARLPSLTAQGKCLTEDQIAQIGEALDAGIDNVSVVEKASSVSTQPITSSPNFSEPVEFAHNVCIPLPPAAIDTQAGESYVTGFSFVGDEKLGEDSPIVNIIVVKRASGELDVRSFGLTILALMKPEEKAESNKLPLQPRGYVDFVFKPEVLIEESKPPCFHLGVRYTESLIDPETKSVYELTVQPTAGKAQTEIIRNRHKFRERKPVASKKATNGFSRRKFLAATASQKPPAKY